MSHQPHLLSFVTDATGGFLSIHTDIGGISLLIAELQALKEQLELNDCPHTHLFSEEAAGDDLTTTKLSDQQYEVNVVHHVKIYGWNEEWAVKHGLKRSPAT
jgi:hypothetical protein